MKGYTYEKYKNKSRMKAQESRLPYYEKGWKRNIGSLLYVCCLTELYSTDVEQSSCRFLFLFFCAKFLPLVNSDL